MLKIEKKSKLWEKLSLFNSVNSDNKIQFTLCWYLFIIMKIEMKVSFSLENKVIIILIWFI